MRRFEYRVLQYVIGNELDGVLKRSGEEGWELVSADGSQSGPKDYTLIFKRELIGTKAWTDLQKSAKKS